MTAQAIEGVIHPSINLTNHNQTSFSFSKESDSLITTKISIAATLALLVGLVQVGSDHC